jgi:hypothetical protein
VAAYENNMNTLRLGSVLLVAAASAGCGTKAPEDPRRDGPAMHDAGAVFLAPEDGRTWTVSHEFPFRNPSLTSPASLRVEKKTCGCTRCTVAQEEVPPGGTTTITLSCERPYTRDSFREAVLISTGLGQLPKLELYLAAELYPRLTMVPDTLPSIGVRAGGSEAVRLTFLAYEPETQKAEPVRVTPLARAISVRLGATSSETRDGIRKTTVDCILTVACPRPDDEHFANGKYRGQLEVKHGDWCWRPAFSWHAKAIVKASPAQVFLQPGSRASEEAVVQITSAEAFTIESTEARSPNVECISSPQKASHGQEVRIRIKRSEPMTGGLKSAVVIHVNHPNQKRVEVPVYVLW